MRIFLTGASGFVGARVLDDLLATGHEVTALVHSDRSFREVADTHPKVQMVRGDVARPEAILQAIPNGTEAVVYLPGLLREFPRKEITFRSVHVEGVLSTLGAAKRAGATRWIEMSALGVRPNATTEYFRTKWEAEEIVGASGLDWTILRPSIIFDDRPSKRTNFAGEIAKAIRMLPFLPILGSGIFRMQPVSVDDVSQTIVQSLTKPETIGKIFELGGPEMLTYTEIVQIIARTIRTKKRALHIPLPLAELAARLFQRFTFFPFTIDQLTMLKEENVVKDKSNDCEWRATFDLPMKRFAESVAKALR